jgi:hypothetical protein
MSRTRDFCALAIGLAWVSACSDQSITENTSASSRPPSAALSAEANFAPSANVGELPGPQFSTGGLVPRLIPEDDPGPPFYARLGRPYFPSDGWLAIPFYRAPACIPPDFNLLDHYDFPSPNGPGAFACQLLVTGTFLIEPDAPLGTFPFLVVLDGAGAPVWFVPSASFDVAAQDGVVTIGELAALNPLRGTARRYHEMLRPRSGEHKIIITADGSLEDGRSFMFEASHIDDQLRSIRIAFQ